MKKLVLVALVVLNLTIAIAFSPFAKSAPLSFATTSPVSPLPPSSDEHGSNSEHESNTISSDAVWVLPIGQAGFRIKTHQSVVGWWDAAGQLHIAPKVNGIVDIPWQQAVMISIPGDAAGVSAPPGWRKLMRPENGEWVIVRLA